jgi:predicted ATPase
MLDRIVITGAPASGKTECVERLSRDTRFEGFVFFDELARRLLTESPALRSDWSAFHREIYRRQCAREVDAAGRAFVSDRGTVDAFAFHPESMADVGTDLEKEYARYDIVVQLGSAAALGPEYYRRDEIRRETIAQALEIEAAIRKVWERHPGYRFIEATIDFEAKFMRLHALLAKNLVEG